MRNAMESMILKFKFKGGEVNMLVGVLNSKCCFGLNSCFSSNWSFNPIFFKTQSSWGDGIKSSWKACGKSGKDRFVNGAPLGGPNGHSGNGNGAPFGEKGGTCGQSGGSDMPNPAKGNDLSIREDSKNPKSKDPESNDSDYTHADVSDDSDYTHVDVSDDSDYTHVDVSDDSDPKHSYPRCTPPHIAALWVLCEDCYQLNYRRFLKERNNMCEHCGYHFKMNSPERIEFLIDPDTWHPIDEDMASPDPDPSEYECALEDLQKEISLIRKAIQKKISEDSFESDSKEVSEDSFESDSKKVSKDPSEYECALKDLQKEISLIQKAIQKKISEDSFESDSKEVSEDSFESDSKEVSEDSFESDSKEVSEDSFESDSKEVSEDSFESDSKEVSEDPSESHSEEEDKPYEDRLDSYRKKTGLNEAIQTGVGQINGIPVAFGIMEFEFMGGSMGSVVGEKIARLVEYAINESLPLIIVCASGGARMQEGSVSLMQMAKISCALLDYDQSNSKLVYISILASPTTGGVTASFGTLADIILAEPNSYIAFAGKRVIEETLKQPIPEGSQEAEPLFEKGILDLIIPRKLLKHVLTEFLQFHGLNPLNSNSIK